MPRRPILRPGSALLRRDSAHLQIGPVVFADRPGDSDLLRSLDGSPTGDEPLLDRLEQAGAVIDTGDWPGGVPRPELHHAALSGADPRPLAGRRSLRVGFTDGCAALTVPLSGLLRRSGVRVAGEPNLVVAATLGEPARESADALVAAGITHVPIALDGTAVRVGPFVIPGHSPCLRCFDAQRASWDAPWPVLVSQFGRTRIIEAAIDALAAHDAAGFLAREILAHAEGRRPETLARRITLDRGRTSVEEAPFASDCACHLALT